MKDRTVYYIRAVQQEVKIFLRGWLGCYNIADIKTNTEGLELMVAAMNTDVYLETACKQWKCRIPSDRYGGGRGRFLNE
ncbi:hypothetical protein [Megasphaera sueciensis]|uniref:hypothetical protein n=1 Tax=Megasphaera sueciensis TaxID=349094 RepID=UPI003CFE51DC